MKVHRANEGPGTLEARWVRTAYFWSFFGGQCHVLIPKKAARSCIIAKQKCRPCPEPRRAIPNIPHDGNSLCTFPGPPAPIQLNPKMSCHSMICSRCCTSAFFRSKIWEGQLAPKITQTEVRSSNPNIPHLRLKIVHRSSLAGWTPVWPSLLTLLTRSLAGSLPHLCSLQSRDKCLSLTLTAHSRRTVASALLQGTQVVRECTHCIVIWAEISIRICACGNGIGMWACGNLLLINLNDNCPPREPSCRSYRREENGCGIVTCPDLIMQVRSEFKLWLQIVAQPHRSACTHSKRKLWLLRVEVDLLATSLPRTPTEIDQCMRLRESVGIRISWSLSSAYVCTGNSVLPRVRINSKQLLST